MPRYRAAIVEVEDELYQIHLGDPGRPRVYRVAKNSDTVRRVRDGETLNKVAVAFKEQYEARKRAIEQEKQRKQKLWPRFLRWIGRLVARLKSLFKRHD